MFDEPLDDGIAVPLILAFIVLFMLIAWGGEVVYHQWQKWRNR